MIYEWIGTQAIQEKNILSSSIHTLLARPLIHTNNETVQTKRPCLFLFNYFFINRRCELIITSRSLEWKPDSLGGKIYQPNRHAPFDASPGGFLGVVRSGAFTWLCNLLFSLAPFTAEGVASGFCQENAPCVDANHHQAPRDNRLEFLLWQA